MEDSDQQDDVALLSDEDVRQIVGILSDVVARQGSVENKRHFLLERLGELIGADCWIWAPVNIRRTKGKAVGVNFICHGFSPQRLSCYYEAIEHPDMPTLNAPFYEVLSTTKAHSTRTRQQLDPSGMFSDFAVYKYWEKAGISEILLSAMPLEEGNISFIGIYRNTGREPFSAREARIAHIVLSEVKWLHMSCFPELNETERFDYSKLSPRLRTILNLLIEGIGRKQIGSHLKISENTVGSYIKEIYRCYKVQSQTELLRLFRDGNGGDEMVSESR